MSAPAAGGSPVSQRAAVLTAGRDAVADGRAAPRTRTRGGEITLDNRLALNRFLAEQERRAFRMAMAATGNDADALDIVQDAMTKLARSYADRGEDEWGPLFHRILQTTIRDFYRRQKVRNAWRTWLRPRSEDDREEPLQTLPDSGADDPEQRLQQDGALDALQDALAALPLRQQQAVLLRVWEGLSVAETAAAMGISEGSVKTHYSRGVHTLRRQLGEHWP